MCTCTQDTICVSEQMSVLYCAFVVVDFMLGLGLSQVCVLLSHYKCHLVIYTVYVSVYFCYSLSVYICCGSLFMYLSIFCLCVCARVIDIFRSFSTLLILSLCVKHVLVCRICKYVPLFLTDYIVVLMCVLSMQYSHLSALCM